MELVALIAVSIVLLLGVVWIVLPIWTLVSVKGLEAQLRELKLMMCLNGVGDEVSMRDGSVVTLSSEEEKPVEVAVQVPVVERPIPEAWKADEAEVKSELAAKVEISGSEKVDAVASEPTAIDLFWEKVEDWFCVRGKFAPKGTTREFAVATRWLVRMGLVMLTASVIYFVKLSIDRGWMGPEARVAATVFWGAVCVACGVWLVRKTRYGLIGHAAAALGVVALYLGFGLGHRYFTPPVIASPMLAFSALVLVTVVAGIVSVVLPSPMIAVMGLVGGYLVPVVAGRDTGCVWGVCLYSLALNAGAFWVARRRGWAALDFLAATCAYVMTFVISVRQGSLPQGTAYVLFAFMTAVHALYMVGVVMGSRVRSRAGNALAWSGLVFNAVIYLGWLGSLFRGAVSSPVTGSIFLVLVAAYLLLAKISIQRGWMDRTSIDILLVFALAYLALAPLLLFSFPWCAVSWTVIAVAAFEAERRTGQKILGILSALLLTSASLVGIFHLALKGYLGGSSFAVGEFAARLLRLWTLPVAVAYVGWRRKAGPLLVVAAVFAFLFLTGEAHLFGTTFLPAMKGGTVTVAWTLTAFGALCGGIVFRARGVRFTGLGILGVSIAKLLLFDTVGLVLPVRVGIFALVGALLMVGAFLYMKFKGRFEENEIA